MPAKSSPTWACRIDDRNTNEYGPPAIAFGRRMRRGSARGACTIAARELRPKASRPSSSTAKLRLLLNTRGNGCAGSRPIGVSTGRSSRKKNSRIHWRCAGFHSSRRGKTMPSRARAGRTMALSSFDLAAAGLGSNSFHLQIGRVVDGQIYPLDAVREVLRLGAGLTAEKRIDRSTQAQALETLAKFAERLRGFSRQAVRAVGTNALRVAKNSPRFLPEARQVLGFPIEVISGREEARLIYLGVAHSLPAAAGPQHK